MNTVKGHPWTAAYANTIWAIQNVGRVHVGTDYNWVGKPVNRLLPRSQAVTWRVKGLL